MRVLAWLAQHGQHEAAGAGAGIGPRFSQRTETCVGIGDLLDDGKQVEGGARQAVNPRHHHHFPGRQVLEHLQKFLLVGPRTVHLPPVNPRAACRLQLRELGIESLAIGADAGIADQLGRGGAAFPGVSFASRNSLIGLGFAGLP